jgi:hypothetical protein
MIICGFPGGGKSCVATNRIHILDLESSAFSWVFDPINHPEGRVRNANFPANYIKAIRNAKECHGYILTASHQVVRDALKAEGIPYIIVAPKRELKNEYLIRYLQRGNEIEFIELLNEKWDAFLDGIENDGAPVIWLDKGEYMSDVLGVIAR